MCIYCATLPRKAWARNTYCSRPFMCLGKMLCSVNCGSGYRALVQQSNCHHVIESISMASHVEGCFLAVISSAKFMHSLHLYGFTHAHVANICSAFPVRVYGEMNGTVKRLYNHSSHYIATCILFYLLFQFCSTHCYTCRFKLQLHPVSMCKWVVYLLLLTMQWVYGMH